MTTRTNEDVTLGEVYRLVLRIDTRTAQWEEEQNDLKRTVAIHSWAIGALSAGALAFLAALVQLVSGK